MTRRFLYVGPEEIRDAAVGVPEGTALGSIDDARSWLDDHRGEGDGSGVWATYIVDTKGVLRVATRNSEHVACAGGGAVLGAGELRFDNDGAIVEISNLSTGYCPESTCWSAVEDAIDRAGIERPDGFTFAVEFRRCTKCEQRNVVKDGWFYCAVCDAPLPAAWNFAP